MSVLERLAGHELWSTLGVVLLHFLWQGTLVALLVASAARALGKAAARERYALFCFGLFALPLLPLITWVYLSGQGLPGGAAIALSPSLPIASVDAYAICGWMWIAGAAAFQLRLALAWFRATQLRRVGTALLEPAWQAELATLGERLGLRRAVRVFSSDRIEVPALVGWLEPVVLVPAGALVQLTSDQLRAVLAHELAHLARFDPWVNAAQSVIESLLFFHPAVWWLSTRIREEREYCCDDLAVEIVRDPLGYARALTSLESLRRQESALVLSSHGGSLMQRIRRITSRPQGAHGRQPLRFVPLLLSGLALSLAGGSAHGWITSSGTSEPHEHAPEVSLPHDGHDSRQEALRKRKELEHLRRRVAELRANLERLEAELGMRESTPLPGADPRSGHSSSSAQAGRAPTLPTLERLFQDRESAVRLEIDAQRSLNPLLRENHTERLPESHGSDLSEQYRATVEQYLQSQQNAAEAKVWQQRKAALSAEAKQLKELHERVRRDAELRNQEGASRRGAVELELLELYRNYPEVGTEHQQAWKKQLLRNRAVELLPEREADDSRRKAWLEVIERTHERAEPGAEPGWIDARFPAPPAAGGATEGDAFWHRRDPRASGEPESPPAPTSPGEWRLPEGIQEKALQGWLESHHSQSPPASAVWPKRKFPSPRAPGDASAPTWASPFGEARGGGTWAPLGEAPSPFQARSNPPVAPESCTEARSETAPEPTSASDAMRETKLLREQVRRLRQDLESLERERASSPN